MAKGGARKGAGRPKGVLNPSTIEKNILRERLRAKVAEKWDAMIEAQVDSSIGLRHFMLRDPKTGQFKRLTDADEIVAALNTEDTANFWVYTKDPANQAFVDLANRTIDKPTEHVEAEVKVSGSIEDRLAAGRKRLAEAKRG